MYDPNALYHHGILGMHWGIRRFQNPDGSRTPAGKKRYSKKDIEDDLSAKMNSDKDTVDRIMTNGSKISEAADDLGNEYDKAYKNFKMDEDSKNFLIKSLRENFGDGCDDEDIFELEMDMLADDVIDRTIRNNKTIAEKQSKFEKLQDDYWKDVHSITDDLMNKYKDVEVQTIGNAKTTGRMVVNDLMGSKLDTSMPSYISRHFDDYWIDDVDSRYAAKERIISSISMDEYNKKYATGKR